MNFVTGSDVEFEYATRDYSYLMLGKQFGDCTAKNTFDQVDRFNIENIYWTVFTWILNRNYQILKVFYNGELVMKIHLVILFVTTKAIDKIFLAIDAIETTREFRDDIDIAKKKLRRNDLLDKKEYILKKTFEKVKKIAEKMGIQNIYSEKFSNSRWVREELEKIQEIYLDVNDIKNLDELEDVFELAQQICREAKKDAVEAVFMELQMKNIYLFRQPEKALKNNIKSFAVIQGDLKDGIPIKNTVRI